MAHCTILNITVQNMGVDMRSDSGDGGYLDPQSSNFVNFELHQSRSEPEQIDMEMVARVLAVQKIAAPLHLCLGPRHELFSSANVPWSLNLSFSVLEAMPTLTTLEIRRQFQNVTSILEQLSTPVRNDADELVWPCPLLVDLCVDLIDADLEQQLLAFIADRCCPQEGEGSPGHLSPIPLSTLTLRIRKQHAFADLVGVGQVKYYEFGQPQRR
ncbi:hypothetical protein FRB96_001871 [Tulasnella sp. 330]|nr:hypothetical protein FRB96_001871 [Tulasnella sp. 330]